MRRSYIDDIPEVKVRVIHSSSEEENSEEEHNVKDEEERKMAEIKELETLKVKHKS